MLRHLKKFVLPVLAASATIQLCALSPVLNAAEEEAGEGDWSIVAPLAPRSLLLGAAASSETAWVVGERGHVLISKDAGQNWRQIRVPTRATLTSVFFIDESLGWAAGHDAVILRTEDGGESWQRMYFAPEEERPLLDVWFEDSEHGIAIGAYGYFLESFDGGMTWEERFFEVEKEDEDEDEEQEDLESTDEITSGADMDAYLDFEDPVSDLHLNNIRQAEDGTLYIAAEAGHIFRSDDSGETWVSLPSPYEGSFYGVLPLDAGDVLVFGLRGNLHFSSDRGESWQPVDIGTDAILTGGVRDENGNPIVLGLGGTLLVGSQAAAGTLPAFRLVQQEDRKALATAIPESGGVLILVGEDGIRKLSGDELGASR